MKKTKKGYEYTDAEINAIIFDIIKVKEEHLRDEILKKIREGLQEGGQA